MGQTEKPVGQANRSVPAVADLRAYVAVVRRQSALVVLITAIVVGTAAFFTLRETPIYVSTARVLVKPMNPNQVLQGYNYNLVVSMDTEVALASSPSVTALAAARVQAAGGSGVQTGELTVEVPPDTTFIDFAYPDPDPETARSWAQAFAEAYMDDRADRALSAYQSARSGYERSIGELQAELERKLAQLPDTPAVEKATLRREIGTLRTQIGVLQSQLAQLPVPGTDTSQMVAAASLPASPSSPKVLQNLVLAFVAGLGLGIVLAAIRERLDDRMLGREDLEERIGAPTLAIVPHVRGWRKRKRPRIPAIDAPRSGPAEAYRTIRASLEHIARDRAPYTFIITSPSLDEGKSTTTANLAVTLAQTGKRVIAVSGDLRKPTLHRFFGLPNEVGLSSYLRGEATIREIAQRCGVSTLRVVAAGPIPHDPSELLASDTMRTLLTELARNADYVLFDSPPVLAVSDPLMLARMVDGVILIADAQTTSGSAMAHVRELLEQVGATIVGGVFNNFDPQRVRYYPRYYRDYYSYYHRSEKRAKASGGPKDRAASQPSAEPALIWEEDVASEVAPTDNNGQRQTDRRDAEAPQELESS